MQATFNIATKLSPFKPGTVGGQWLWYLTKAGKDELPVKWFTEDATTKVDVEDKTIYTIGAQRVDTNKSPLGALVETEFSTADDAVLISVAAAINVILTP